MVSDGTVLVGLDGVSYTHPSGSQPALRDVRLDVYAGERLAILGPNGAGKTTVLRILHGGLPPTSGASRRHVDSKAVGMVVQDPDDQLFGAIAREDVSFGPLNLGLTGAELAARVSSALRQAGATHLADRQLSRLSVGERRRVAIAGVLALEPALLLCDEPTAGLDQTSRTRLGAVLHGLAERGAAVVVASHDVDFVYEWADRTVVLHEGAVVATGPTTDVLSDRGVLERAELAAPFVCRVTLALARTGWPLDCRAIRSIDVLEQVLATVAGPATRQQEARR
jgi:cobalt/nickel transport system ATP-binding protein